MVPPVLVVADHDVVMNPVLEIVFPDHVIRFTRDMIMNVIMHQQPIGQGTTATVYHGILGGREAAIKCIRSEYAQQFVDELKIISRCNHPNIVRLIGYCIEEEDHFIVYEYMRGGSLDALISRKGEYAANPRPLPWKKRLEIAFKVLEGIRYLQEEIEGETGVVHVDLKPENILMDEDLNPYLADFGAAVTIEKGNINATTEKKKFLGTFGYMDTIANNGFVTLGSDVFSFGSILLDLVMGRDLHPKKMEPVITPDYVSHIMDPSLIADQFPLEEVTEVVELVSRYRMEARESRRLLEEVIDCLTAIKDR